MEQINKEQTIEDILKEFSAQGELVNGLGDVLMHIALAGNFNENGDWQEPEWKKVVLHSIAQARELIQKLYFSGLNCRNGSSYTELRSKAAQENVDNLYRSEFKKELATMIDYALNHAKPGVIIVDLFSDRILESAKIEMERNRETPA